MIRIKNNIFNENKIIYMSEFCDGELQIVFENGDDIYTKATFDDIEWNYEDSFVQRMEEECRKLKEEIKKFDVIKQLIKQEEKIYGSLTDAEEIILKTIDGEE